MPVTIKNDAQEVLFQEEVPFSHEKTASPVLGEDTHAFRRDFGEVRFQEYFFDGIMIGFGQASAYQNLHIHNCMLAPVVGTIFLENGNFLTSVEGIYQSFPFASREHNLLFHPLPDDKAVVMKQNDISMVVLNFTRERFLQMAENNGRVLENLASSVAVNRPAMLNLRHNQPITPRMNAVITEMKACQYTGGLKKLFLQSKVMELLALQCEQQENTPVSNTGRLRGPEIERIYHARDVLLRDIQSPPTLSALSRLSGLNEFKLKNGFRQVFGTTVFGYLNDHRLEAARLEILIGHKTLKEIAEDTGYSSPQHFCNAFKKKFGVSPGKLQ